MTALRERAFIAIGSRLDRLYGRDTARFLPFLEGSQYWPPEKLLGYRRSRLQGLLEHCYDSVRYYRERMHAVGLDRPDLSRADEALAALPPLTKLELRDHGAELVVPNAGPMHRSVTSGTSGTPVTVHHDRRGGAWARAVQRRAFGWHGVDIYSPRVAILSAPQTLRGRLKHAIVDVLTGRRLFLFHDLSSQRTAHIINVIRRFRPAIITAYPSVLHDFCHGCEDLGVSFAGSEVRLLHTQSEMQLEHHSATFVRTFGGVPVLNEYGCVEVGAMAYTCPKGSFHISHDHVVLEVVGEDQRPAAAGEAGRVLLTPLEVRGMPLLRYEVGDVATLRSGEDCACGRMPGLPLLKGIEGRVFDRIVGSDGRIFNAGVVHFLMRRSELIGHTREYLARQTQRGRLELMVVPLGTLPVTAGRRLDDAAVAVFGVSVTVDLHPVAAIPREGERKRRYFVSEIGSDGRI